MHLRMEKNYVEKHNSSVERALRSFLLFLFSTLLQHDESNWVSAVVDQSILGYQSNQSYLDCSYKIV